MHKIIEVPQDKYWVSKLEDCWESLVLSNEFDKEFFCKLSAKTYELFKLYFDVDKIPKELIRLISVIGAFVYTKKGDPFSDIDIARAVAEELLRQLEIDRKFEEAMEVNKNRGRKKKKEEYDEFFTVWYDEKKFQISTDTFDITPIMEAVEAAALNGSN